MSISGSNLPYFRSVQLDFADHIRNPEVNPLPADIEPRRMQIYVDLFFNNIQNFLASAFPIAKDILGEQQWLTLVRAFVHRHPSESPFFLQISQEFLTFLHDRSTQTGQAPEDGEVGTLPDFLLELCHYEWVELSLDVAADQPVEPVAARFDVQGHLVKSKYMRPLVYSYPVHHIGAGHIPSGPPPQAPTFLIVYRNDQLAVKFVASNPVTHRLLELLDEHDAATALRQIHEELQAGGRQVGLEQVREQGFATLTQLHSQGIILGSR